MASSTLLLPLLWLPMTTMLGSTRLSSWSMLSKSVRISMSRLVKAMRPLVGSA